MSAEAREKARERGQKSGKGTQTVSRILERLGLLESEEERAAASDE